MAYLLKVIDTTDNCEKWVTPAEFFNQPTEDLVIKCNEFNLDAASSINQKGAEFALNTTDADIVLHSKKAIYLTQDVPAEN